jgi:drug/metabolite transporter (DMT)-like permease
MGDLQKRSRLDPTYITSHIMGNQLIMLIVVVLMTEPVLPMQANSIFEYQWSTASVLCVVGTTCFAVLLNLSGAWVLGAFNAVTYSVVGYFKTVAVLATGIVVFGDEFSLMIGLGIALVLVGSVLYNRAK